MSDETPIYDATCAAVGPPPAADGAEPETTDVAGHPPSAGTGPGSPEDDPLTADLSIPRGDPSPR